MSVTQPLRAEHAELRPHLDEIDALAAEVSAWTDATPTHLAASVEFLQHHLLPHARAEEAVLYPTIDRAMGSPEVTATMVADHRDVTRRVDALAATAARLGTERPADEDVESLKAQLYGLGAILHLHFAKEEEVLLPMLDDRLDDEQARDMFAAMARVAHPDTAGTQ